MSASEKRLPRPHATRARRPLRSKRPAEARSAQPRSRPRSRFVIDIADVTKTYELGDIKVPALRGVSMRIERGDFVAIMGSSGSGKSTLLNILGCLDAPTSGRYLLDGIDVRDFDEVELADIRNRKIGFVFQSFNLVPRTRAVANVELPLAYAGMHRAERHRRALKALHSVGMSHRVNHLPSELSGGQQQRVAMARAIVTNPSLVLGDEPTGNLDSHSSAEVLQLFGRLNLHGSTVLIITHEDHVAAIAKRTIRIADGQIVEDRRIAEVDAIPPALRDVLDKPDHTSEVR